MQMIFIKRYWPKILTAVLIIVIFFWKGCEVTKREPQIVSNPIPIKPDTIKPKEFKSEPPKPKVTPQEVEEFQVVKKEKRKEIEKQSEVIEQVEVQKEVVGEQLKVTTIDTSGKEVTKVFEMPAEEKGEVVDSLGNVGVIHKTKAGRIIQKIGRATKHVLIVTGGVAIVTVTAIAGAPVIAVVSVGVVTAVVVVAAIKSDK